MNFLFQYIDKQSKSSKIILGIILIAVIGIIDYLTTLEISFSLFYLFPVAIIAWFLGRWPAIFVSAVCGAIFFFADLLASRIYSHPIIPYWNMLVEVIFFVVVSLLLSALRRSLEKEQKLARQIQQSLLPKEMPKVDGVHFSCSWRPSEAVGGDHYDLFTLNNHQVICCIADVIGHGIPAALIMANLQAAVKIFSSDAPSPAELCQKVNKLMCSNLDPGKFVTFFCCMLNTSEKTLMCCNAGHNPPVLARQGNIIKRIETGGLALGLKKDASYEQNTIDLVSGDRLVIFTDGLIETKNLAGEQFGEERLLALIKTNSTKSAEQLRQNIVTAVINFGHGIPEDDITTMVIVIE